MKKYKPIVLARMIGTYGIILGYFITLHISTYLGAMFNVVFELMALPFYLKNKMWDVVIMFIFLLTIGFSKLAVGVS
tara:strand:+ start:8441 stop:8671 length:231 start_codon:yes stop_codon:yes gene_type:complete